MRAASISGSGPGDAPGTAARARTRSRAPWTITSSSNGSRRPGRTVRGHERVGVRPRARDGGRPGSTRTGATGTSWAATMRRATCASPHRDRSMPNVSSSAWCSATSRPMRSPGGGSPHRTRSPGRSDGRSTTAELLPEERERSRRRSDQRHGRCRALALELHHPAGAQLIPAFQQRRGGLGYEELPVRNSRGIERALRPRASMPGGSASGVR